MNYKMPTKIEDAFFNSFEHYPLSTDWQKELYNYIVLGFPPGGFHTAVFANDLMRAASISHPSNTWSEIITMCNWLTNVAPHQSRGSHKTVEAWLRLSATTRKKILEVKGLLYTEKEVVWNILQKPM